MGHGVIMSYSVRYEKIAYHIKGMYGYIHLKRKGELKNELLRLEGDLRDKNVPMVEIG